MEVGLGEKQSCQTLTGKPMANAARCKVNQIDIISKHPREKHALFNDWTHSSKFFFVKTEVPKVHAAFSKSYVHWGFIQYGWFLSTLKSSKLPFGFFTCWICFRSIIVVAGNARQQCQTFPKDKQVCSSDPSTLHVARFHHPPTSVTDSKVDSKVDSKSGRSGPQRSKWEKQSKLQRNMRTSEGDGAQWWSVVMGQVV